jgi:hypothetical protein
MTPQQRAREKRASRAAALAERDAKLKTGEAKTALVKSAGVVLGHAGAALMIGAAFGAGSYLAMKGAGVDASRAHRAVAPASRKTRRRYSQAADARAWIETPKPESGRELPRSRLGFQRGHGVQHEPLARREFRELVAREHPVAVAACSGERRRAVRVAQRGGPRRRRPRVASEHAEVGRGEVCVTKKPDAAARDQETAGRASATPEPAVGGALAPRLDRNNGAPRNFRETRDEKVVSNAGTASSTPRTLEVSDMSHIAEGPNDPEKEIEDSRSLPNTARRAAEALASERSLKSSLNEARDKLARYERVVKSERRAKMAAVEHAAKLAAAAEALADLERGDDGDDVEQNDSLSSPRIAARAADLAFDALMSPSSRDGDDAAALASMREKERAQYEKAEAALARARGARRARDKLLLEERAKWTRVLEVAKAESGKAHEEAERREASLREMFAKQKARVDALNVELESASAASARADAASRDAAAKAKRAEAKAEKAAREARDLKAGDNNQKSSGTAGSGSVSPRAARAAETEAAARSAAAEAAAAAKEAAFHRAASEKSVGELDRVTRAAEAEISQAKREADALRAELDRAARAAKEREKAHAADLKRREAEFEKRDEKAKAEAKKTVARVSTSASADLKAALDREKKLEDLLRRAEAKEKRLVQEQKALVEAQRDARADGAGGSREGSAGTEYASAAGSWPSDERDETSRNLVSENAAHAAELDRLRLEAARERAAALEELRAVHAADLEKRGGALRATREQLQEASREVASLREQFDVSSKSARAAELAAAEASAEAQSRARAAEATRAALQDAVSLAVASGASEEEVIAAMRKRGVAVERTERGLTVTF